MVRTTEGPAEGSSGGLPCGRRPPGEKARRGRRAWPAQRVEAVGWIRAVCAPAQWEESDG
jgi:hypothetical protein